LKATCASKPCSTTATTIKDAMSSGTMWRGIETILKGRDPRDAWAFVERICGVCTTVHALASVRAVENAVGITIPKNAEIIRNIMYLAQTVQDHVIHFYHLHALDWVDVVSALKGEPRGDGGAGSKGLPLLAAGVHGILFGYPGHAEEVRRIRAARHLPERLLGPSRRISCRRKPT
jgi:Ni,Fe-hydrogenase I large subunit